MSEVEKTRVCTQCRLQFQERSNIGKHRCRFHPGPRRVRTGTETHCDSRFIYDCCGYVRASMHSIIGDMVTGLDILGCTPCDHSEKQSITETPTAILPLFLVENNVVNAPHPSAVVARVTRETIEKIRGQRARGTPTSNLVEVLGSHVDIVKAAFQVLRNFAESRYYGMDFYTSCSLYSAQIEEHVMTKTLVESAWDSEIDLTGFDTFGDTAKDETTPYRNRRHTSTSRVAAVSRLQASNDLNTLAKVVIPFYVLRRFSESPDETTVRNFDYYDKYEAQ